MDTYKLTVLLVLQAFLASGYANLRNGSTNWQLFNQSPQGELVSLHSETVSPPPVNKIIHCQEGLIYDKTLARCISEERESTEGDVFQLQLLLYNKSLHKLGKKGRHHLGNALFDFVMTLASLGTTSRFSYSVGAFKEIPKWWKKRNSTALPIYFSARFQVDTNEIAMNHVLRALGDSITVDFKGQLIEMAFILFNGSYSIKKQSVEVCDKVSQWDDDIEYLTLKCLVERKRGGSKDIEIPTNKNIFYEMSCPYMELTENDDYELDTDGVRLVFKDFDKKSERLDDPFTFHGEDMITICRDIYMKYYNATWGLVRRLGKPISRMQWIVTIVCVSLSLTGLFLTFLTYCVFPSLRTMPIRNNMALMMFLFVSQMLYVIGYLRTEDKLLCQILGVALHYFWLASIFWMNVCCFHVFQGFVLSKTVSATTRPWAVLTRYFMYANGIPLIIVSTVITTNQILTHGQETGYGGTFCFLSTVLLNGLTVALPLCFVLFSNFVFFAATIYTISKTKQIRRNTGGDRHNLWIYIKLSTITGLFWVFEIVDAAFAIEALTYITIVLNSSQGVFLFISYCCNRRVARLWKNKLISHLEETSVGNTATSNQTKETETMNVRVPFEESPAFKSAEVFHSY